MVLGITPNCIKRMSIFLRLEDDDGRWQMSNVIRAVLLGYVFDIDCSPESCYRKRIKTS
jgi:hypothetical protein